MSAEPESPAAWAEMFAQECAALDRDRPPLQEARERLTPLLFVDERKTGIPYGEAREEIQKALRRLYPEETAAERKELAKDAAQLDKGEKPDSPPAEDRLTISWDEFMAETYPPVPSLWGSALLVKGGGYLILSGDTGVGKTILMANLILSLAEGRDEFLGFPLPGRPVLSLFLEAEGSRQLFRGRLAQIASNRGIRISPPIRFHSRGAELTIEQLGNMVADSKAEHGFLDPVGRFHSGNENDTGDWRACVTNPLAGLANALAIAQSFCDHYSKPNENRSGQHKVRGAAAKVQDCGAAMRLEYGQGGGSSRTLFFDRVRDGALPFPDRDPSRMPLLIDVAAGTIAVDEREDADLGTTHEPRMDDVARLVEKLSASSEVGKVSTASLRLAIESNLDLSRTRAYDLITAAKKAKKISSAGRGYYCLPVPATLLQETS